MVKTGLSDALLTVSEVANLFRVDDTTIRRWAKEGALPVIVLPHTDERQTYRFKRSVIDAALNNTTLTQAQKGITEVAL